METFCTDTRKHAEKLLIFSETTWNLLSFQVVTYIPVNPPPLRGSLPHKSLISRMDWVSCTGDINLPHTPFPPTRSSPQQKNQVQ